jgi:hypothetical protein
VLLADAAILTMFAVANADYRTASSAPVWGSGELVVEGAAAPPGYGGWGKVGGAKHG